MSLHKAILAGKSLSILCSKFESNIALYTRVCKSQEVGKRKVYFILIFAKLSSSSTHFTVRLLCQIALTFPLCLHQRFCLQPSKGQQLSLQSHMLVSETTFSVASQSFLRRLFLLYTLLFLFCLSCFFLFLFLFLLSSPPPSPLSSSPPLALLYPLILFSFPRHILYRNRRMKCKYNVENVHFILLLCQDIAAT